MKDAEDQKRVQNAPGGLEFHMEDVNDQTSVKMVQKVQNIGEQVHKLQDKLQEGSHYVSGI